jgi:methionyl-tRNA formyltransferase
MTQPLLFFGADQYAAIVLDALLSHKYDSIISVVTDQWSIENPVEKVAKAHMLKISYYKDFSHDLITNNTLGLSASFPHLFAPNIIHAFAGRLFNLHPSLLPQYRNVAPVPYALAMGDAVTGISLFPIAVGIDNGQLVAQKSVPINHNETTPELLVRLFTLGAELFLSYLKSPNDPTLADSIPVYHSSELIFTRRITREFGYVEWDLVKLLLSNQSIAPDQTANPLLRLRLTHHPDRIQNMLSDLIRALTGYEKVWTKAPTKKGELTVSLTLNSRQDLQVLIPGKPRPIMWSDFTNYYIDD